MGRIDAPYPGELGRSSRPLRMGQSPPSTRKSELLPDTLGPVTRRFSVRGTVQTTLEARQVPVGVTTSTASKTTSSDGNTAPNSCVLA